jgi:Holliday junction DNA helicase RuvB
MSEEDEQPLDQPQEINDFSPSALKHIVGQESVKAQVAVALEAAWADQKRFDSSLLVGAPGLGKSAMAGVIAKEMASNVHEVLGQSISSAADLNALLLGAEDRDVVHIDEAHELDREFQTALYLAIDQKKLFLQSQNPGRKPQAIPIGDFTLLLSTTDEYCLLQPLRDRMRLTLRFEFYSPSELVEVVRQRTRALKWDVAEDVLPQIAGRSRGTPRLALRLLQSCRRVCRAGNATAITAAHLDKACLLEQIDPLGLGPIEQRYIAILSVGATRLNVLASMLGLPGRTISHVTEPFLIRAGLLSKDDQGRRVLTAEGREHLVRMQTDRK